MNGLISEIDSCQKKYKWLTNTQENVQYFIKEMQIKQRFLARRWKLVTVYN